MDDKNITDIQDPTPAVVASKRRRGFSLLDLMVAASVFVISFSILQNAPEASASVNLKDPIWNGVFQAVMSVFISLSLFATIQILRDWWTREGRFHPGHLMIGIELLAMFSIVLRAVILALVSSTEFYSNGTDGSGLFVANVWSGVLITSRCITTGLALYGSFVKASNWGWWWRVTFVAIALLSVSGIVDATAMLSGGYSRLSLLLQINRVIFILIILSVTTSVIVDAMTRVSRDTNHWLGIVCYIGKPIFAVCFLLVAYSYFSADDIFQPY